MIVLTEFLLVRWIGSVEGEYVDLTSSQNAILSPQVEVWKPKKRIPTKKGLMA